MCADQPWLGVFHCHCHSKVQSVIHEVLCVPGWVMGELGVMEELTTTKAINVRLHVIISGRCQCFSMMAIIC